MVWFFSRGARAVRLETRFDNLTGDYILETTWDDRRPTTERFSRLEAFKARVVMIENQLAAEQWIQNGGPEILPHGWRGPIPH